MENTNHRFGALVSGTWSMYNCRTNMTARAPATRPHGQSYLSYSLTGITEKYKVTEINKEKYDKNRSEQKNKNGWKISKNGRKIEITVLFFPVEPIFSAYVLLR